MNYPKYRWHITSGFTILLGIVGFVIGYSIDSNHPDDRMADILIPTMILSTLGALIEYVSALIYYRRFNWFDGLVSLAIPFLGIYGFWLGKSGNWTAFQMCNRAVLMMLGYLVIRFWIANKKHTTTDERTDPKTPPKQI